MEKKQFTKTGLIEFVKSNSEKKLFKVWDINNETKTMLLFGNDLRFFDLFNFKANRKAKNNDLKKYSIFKLIEIENTKVFGI